MFFIKIELRGFEGLVVRWNIRFFNGPQLVSMQIASMGKRDRGFFLISCSLAGHLFKYQIRRRFYFTNAADDFGRGHAC